MSYNTLQCVGRVQSTDPLCGTQRVLVREEAKGLRLNTPEVQGHGGRVLRRGGRLIFFVLTQIRQHNKRFRWSPFSRGVSTSDFSWSLTYGFVTLLSSRAASLINKGQPYSLLQLFILHVFLRIFRARRHPFHFEAAGEVFRMQARNSQLSLPSPSVLSSYLCGRNVAF
jgi:hypothetical protein